MRRSIICLTVSGSLVLLAGCDAWLEYTVVNQTDQTLLTWPSWTGCNDPSGPDTHPDADTVRPGARYVYDHSFSPTANDPKCVVVADSENRAVLLAPYSYGETYIVAEPLAPGDALPEDGSVPDNPLSVVLTGVFFLLAVLFVLGFLAALPAAFLFGAYYIGRAAYRRVRGGTSPGADGTSLNTRP